MLPEYSRRVGEPAWVGVLRMHVCLLRAPHGVKVNPFPAMMLAWLGPSWGDAVGHGDPRPAWSWGRLRQSSLAGVRASEYLLCQKIFPLVGYK